MAGGDERVPEATERPCGVLSADGQHKTLHLNVRSDGQLPDQLVPPQAEASYLQYRSNDQPGELLALEHSGTVACETNPGQGSSNIPEQLSSSAYGLQIMLEDSQTLVSGPTVVGQPAPALEDGSQIRIFSVDCRESRS